MLRLKGFDEVENVNLFPENLLGSIFALLTSLRLWFIRPAPRTRTNNYQWNDDPR